MSAGRTTGGGHTELPVSPGHPQSGIRLAVGGRWVAPSGGYCGCQVSGSIWGVLWMAGECRWRHIGDNVSLGGSICGIVCVAGEYWWLHLGDSVGGRWVSVAPSGGYCGSWVSVAPSVGYCGWQVSLGGSICGIVWAAGESRWLHLGDTVITPWWIVNPLELTYISKNFPESSAVWPRFEGKWDMLVFLAQLLCYSFCISTSYLYFIENWNLYTLVIKL